MRAGSIPAPSTNKSAVVINDGTFLLLGQKAVPKKVPSANGYRKRFLQMKKPYKLPTIIRSKNGDWFVKYFYERPNQPGVFKEFRVRDGINYIHDIEEKERQILKLQSDITIALEQLNYSPFTKDTEIKKQIQLRNDQLDQIDLENKQKTSTWTLQEGIKAFMSYCRWKELSENTIRSYQTFINNFTEWITETGKLDFTAAEYLETDIIKFLDTYYDQEDWEPRTYNNHISFFITLFKRMETEERKIKRTLKYHINLSDIETKTDKAEKNKAYSGIVADRVKKELSNQKYIALNRFIKFIYLSCMRPKEIRLLEIQNIDIINKQIKVTGPTGKTGDRFVPISHELMDLLNELNIESLPLNYFLFGKGGVPSDENFPKNYFSDMYFNIKSKLGLDKNYTMYGWKHTRVIDLASAGFSDQEIMQLTGHTNNQSFMAYKRDLIVNTTTMKGKTIGW